MFVHFVVVVLSMGFDAITSCAYGRLLTLCSGITSGRFQGTIFRAKEQQGSVSCKASALYSLHSVWPSLFFDYVGSNYIGFVFWSQSNPGLWILLCLIILIIIKIILPSYCERIYGGLFYLQPFSLYFTPHVFIHAATSSSQVTASTTLCFLMHQPLSSTEVILVERRWIQTIGLFWCSPWCRKWLTWVPLQSLREILLTSQLSTTLFQTGAPPHLLPLFSDCVSWGLNLGCTSPFWNFCIWRTKVDVRYKDRGKFKSLNLRVPSSWETQILVSILFLIKDEVKFSCSSTDQCPIISWHYYTLVYFVEKFTTLVA